tara:strand:+ start:10536 stop:11030 length:495 start_codon:yes stop_codon:yes gene_type:complete
MKPHTVASKTPVDRRHESCINPNPIRAPHTPTPTPTMMMTTRANAAARAPVAISSGVRRRARAVMVRAESEEGMNQEMSGGEIGLGGLEDMMDKADGGATPDFVKSLGVKELDDVFAILGSQTKGAELGQLVLSEKFGETLYRESGFTATAETINGRCAVRARW